MLYLKIIYYPGRQESNYIIKKMKKTGLKTKLYVRNTNVRDRRSYFENVCVCVCGGGGVENTFFSQ